MAVTLSSWTVRAAQLAERPVARIGPPSPPPGSYPPPQVPIIGPGQPQPPFPPTALLPPVPQPPKKRHTGRIVLLSILGSLVLLCVIGTIGAALSNGDKPKPGANTVATVVATTQPAATAATKAPSPPPATTKAAAVATTKAAPPPATTPAAPAAPQLTVSQQQALGKARDYLDFTHFSRTGLIDQLKFDGFSIADATFAVDHVGADWNAEAAGKAQDYMSLEHFSHSGLVDQLEFDGFTAAQAEYGAKSVGL